MYANTKLNPTTFIGAKNPVPPRPSEPDDIPRTTDRNSDREIPLPRTSENAARSMHDL